MTGLDLQSPVGLTLAVLPELILTFAALVALMANAWRHTTAADSRLAGWISLAGVVASGVALAALWQSGATSIGDPHMVALDGYRYAALALILIATAAAILLSLDYLERENLIAPEYYSLMLMSAVGMMFLAGSEDLIVLFLGLEIMSVPVYVLAGYNRRNAFSAEAALKYFLIGAFASAFLLYGIALVYGATGTTALTEIGVRLGARPLTLLSGLGVGFLIIGLGFKVASVPFHMWAPDVYDGAPTPVTAFMATGVKIAGFVSLVRVLLVGFPNAVDVWQPVIGVMAAASMIVGNLVALAQRSIKRLLAYSSIAHAGYLLAAVWPGTRAAASATMLYLVAYTFTTFAAFAILTVLGRNGERDVTLDSITGLSARRPWLAFGFSVTMFSLLGFPLTFGFIGKWSILNAMIAEHYLFLPVILVVTTLLSAGYYLPIVRAMFMKDSDPTSRYEAAVLPRPAMAAVVVSVAIVLILGIWPQGVMTVVDHAARSFSTRSSDVTVR
ncbi:MAG: NADH-quinone oxidoreductase subunit N [Gemmatimonadota bacterium]